jgi:membrane associated rhomboid family serine protease
MIPLRDINPTRRFAWVTLGLILLNVVVFFLWEPLGGDPSAQQTFFFCHAEVSYEVTHQTSLAEGGPGAVSAIEHDAGATPAEASEVQQSLQKACPHKSWLASVFVSMFLHGGLLHLAGNMLFLWVFGNNVEDRFGHLRYLLFYLAGGLAAAGLQIAFGPNSVLPSLGASGAIAAVLGAYIVMWPRARVKTLVFVFPVDLSAGFLLGWWFFVQLFHGVGGLGTQVNGGVAYWAHIGGFLFGLAVAWAVTRGSDTSNGGVSQGPWFAQRRPAASDY